MVYSTIGWLDCTDSAGKMNNELEIINNEVVAEYFEVIPGKCLEGQSNGENCSQYSLCPRLNPDLHQQVAEMKRFFIQLINNI